jgi:hypothetical protein
LPEEADIVFEIEADIPDPVKQHGSSFYSHAEGITGIFAAVDIACFQDVGIHHSASQDFEPTGIFAQGTSFSPADGAAHVHFSRRFREREIRRPQPDGNLFAE